MRTESEIRDLLTAYTHAWPECPESSRGVMMGCMALMGWILDIPPETSYILQENSRLDRVVRMVRDARHRAAEAN